MRVIAILLLQAGAAAASPPERIDLLHLTRPACTGERGEVVVCARSHDDRRIRPLAPSADMAVPRNPLTWRVPGGGAIDLHAVQSELPGARGNGAAATLSIPFGRGVRAR